jgi:F-type H+-transporting ATPase subunit delta
MNESQISVRYAKALFKSASEMQILDQVFRDMELVSGVCQLEDFKYVLELPSLQASQKCRMVDSVLKDQISEISVSMINLVIQNNREIYLSAIARNFGDLYRQARGIRKASLVTAKPVDEATLDGIKKLIARAYDTKVELKTAVDQDVIGGFVLTIEDQQYDASVATSLRKLKKQLLKTSIEKK